MENINNDLAKELLTVIYFLDEKYIKIIPEDLFNIIVEKATLSTKEIHLEKDKPLLKQNLSEECKDWITLLYYIQSNPEEQKNLIKLWEENDK